MDGLSDAPALESVDLTGNLLTRVDNLHMLTCLRSLVLACNQLQDVDSVAQVTKGGV